MANYAQALGIHNKWAPILFTVIYLVLLVWYIFQAVRRHRTVYGALAFFAATRLVAYSLRAALANEPKDAQNKGIGIAYEVLYSVGFFSLLLSAYNLLHNRERLARFARTGKNVDSFFHRGRIVHFLLFLAVILGTVGIVYALGTWGHNLLGNRLNSASTYIFLVVALIIALLTLLLIRLERYFRSGTVVPPEPINVPHHHLILLIIATLLLLRTLFYAVTVHDRLRGQSTSQSAQTNERLWYPLAALTELLVALLFIVPGLVPLRSLLARHRGEGATGTYAGEKPGYGVGPGTGTGLGTAGRGTAV